MSNSVNVVSAALFDGDNVLLVQRKHPPFQHYWSLPGGRMQPDESAKDAIQREIMEETGLSVSQFQEVQQHTSAGYTLQVFVAHADIAKAQALDDAAAVQIASLHEVPDLTYTPDLWDIIRAAHQRLTEL